MESQEKQEQRGSRTIHTRTSRNPWSKGPLQLDYNPLERLDGVQEVQEEPVRHENIKIN